MKIDKNNLTYSNEHPKGKKPTGDGSIKVAKSKQMKIRELKLMEDFDEALENYMIKFNTDSVPSSEQKDIYRRLEKKILGRNRT
jgi:hypothetical protein